MDIKVLKDESKKLADFNTEEWGKINPIHYGQKVSWRIEKIFLEVKEGDKIIGSAKIHLEMDVAWVEEVLVGENARGKGVGKRILQKIEEVVKEKGCHKIFLQTGIDWDTVGFYEKAGYKVTNDLPDHFLHHHMVEMTKFI